MMHGKSGEGTMTGEEAQERCAEMMAQRTSMRQERQAMDRRLDSLVDEMKAAEV